MAEENELPDEALSILLEHLARDPQDATAHDRADVLGTWLHPAFRDRYAGARPEPLLCAPLRPAPREFMDGVGRLGHALVREIYSLNDQMPVVGLRNLIRHTGTGRPHEMPLTEDWLVDFGRFFAIDGS
jgi:hypothetical protein